MSRMISAAAVAAVVLTGTAFAQTAPAPAAAGNNEKFFLGVSVGGLLNTNLVTSLGSSAIYGQTAQAAERRDVSGGLLFDMTASMPLRGRLGVGAHVSFKSVSSDSAIAAAIPHPLFSDAPRTVATTTKGLSNQQTWFGLLATYAPQSSGKVAVHLFAGPAVVIVKHDTLGSFTATETSIPSQPTIAITKGSASKTLVGATAGGDISYRVNDKISLGVFARYTGAQGNITGAESRAIGGLQAGGGLRFSFKKN